MQGKCICYVSQLYRAVKLPIYMQWNLKSLVYHDDISIDTIIQMLFDYLSLFILVCSPTHGSQSLNASSSADSWTARSSPWRPAPMQPRTKGYPLGWSFKSSSLSSSVFEPQLLAGSLSPTTWRTPMSLMETSCSQRTIMEQSKPKSPRTKRRMTIEWVLRKWGCEFQSLRRSVSAWSRKSRSLGSQRMDGTFSQRSLDSEWSHNPHCMPKSPYDYARS